MNAAKARRARRYARACRLYRLGHHEWINYLPARLVWNPAWRERHLLPQSYRVRGL